MFPYLLVGFLLALALSAFLAFVSLRLHARISELERELKGMRVKRGMNVEQLIPLSGRYPYDARGFRFIGDPVDGIQFNDDSIVIVEFKSGKAGLGKRQREIRRLVEEGKVRFEIYRVE